MIKKAHKYIVDAYSLIVIAHSEEDDALANMPGNLVNSEKYEKMENNVDLLDTAKDLLEDAENVISDILAG